MTSSRFWGVYWDRRRKKWKVQYRDADGKYRNCGRFDDEEEAARACAEEGMKGLQTMKNEELRSLSHEQCHAGTEYMARKVIEATVEGDATKERLWQKALAKALLRWTQERNIADKDDDHTAITRGAFRRS